jgi:(S)-mandelate dehydrogenase
MRRYHLGSDFRRAHSIEELAAMARHRLPHFAWEYLAGGAEEELTLARNRQAFADIAFLPHTLVPFSDANTRRTLFGREMPLPMAIGPTGYNGMLFKDADIQLARAATERGLPFSLSTVATNSMEQVVAAVPDVNLWLQLYCLRDPAIREDMLQRASAVGCQTLLLTSDAVLLGKREWDRRNFARPRQLTLRNKLDVLRHPRWLCQALWPKGMPSLANLERYLPPEQRNAGGGAHFMGAQMDTGLDWEYLARLRDRWPQNLVLKGVMHPADAEKAVALGLDGIVITNHGGRQLDGVPASIDCLPAIAAVAKGKLALLLDSGIRRGTDVIKACALGADAVLLGRATLYGVAVGGQAGAGHALDLLAEELRLALYLLGQPDLSAVGVDFSPSCMVS